MAHTILTTHAGSLPRPKALASAHARQFAGQQSEDEAFEQLVADATRAVVRKQVETGLDRINNGEVGRERFFTYVRHRMTGFVGAGSRPPMRDMVKYPDFLAYLLKTAFHEEAVSLGNPPEAVGGVTYPSTDAIDAECEQLLDALKDHGRSPETAFVSSPSPGIVAAAMKNRHYPGLYDYIDAVADALRTEYGAILGHGFDLQIDAPDLAMERHTLFADKPLEDFLAFVKHVAASINRVLADAPTGRVRLHVCWGNYEGPHDEDVPLEAIWPEIRQIKAGKVLVSMANPRHEHEYRLFSDGRLGSDVTLVAGVIDTTTNYIEHPDAVAERILRIVDAVGDPSRVMAGTDCGFETSAGFGSVVEDVVWAKLRALVEGARRASARL